MFMPTTDSRLILPSLGRACEKTEQTEPTKKSRGNFQ